MATTQTLAPDLTDLRSLGDPAWASSLAARWRAASVAQDRARLRDSATSELPSGELATLEILPSYQVGLDRFLARASVIYRRVDVHSSGHGSGSVVGGCAAQVCQRRGSADLVVLASSTRPEAGCCDVAELRVRAACASNRRGALECAVSETCRRVGLWAAADLLGEVAELAWAARDESRLALAAEDYRAAVYCGPILQIRGQRAVVVPDPGCGGRGIVARFCRSDLAQVYLGWHAHDLSDFETAS